MKRRTILRVSIGVAVGFAALFPAAWLAFVPSPREPGYIFVSSWGHKGAGPGEFHDPTGIAVAGGEVFVADARNGRVQVFDLDGGFKRQIGEPGEAPGQLGRPMNLRNHRVQKFTSDGTFLTAFGQPGSAPGQFRFPTAVAIAEDGSAFVTDLANHRVQKWRPALSE